jgi:hypothetical protein
MLTQERLKCLLSYDPETGIFRHLRSGHGVRKGDIAGSSCDGKVSSYWSMHIEGMRFYAHRLAWFYVHGEWPDQIDHIDRNKRNNSILNLRVSTCSQNQINTIKISKPNKHGFRGVHFRPNRKKRYVAKITVNGKNSYLGCFDTAEEAHLAYVEAAEKHFGEFADIHRRAVGAGSEEARG